MCTGKWGNFELQETEDALSSANRPELGHFSGFAQDLNLFLEDIFIDHRKVSGGAFCNHNRFNGFQ